MKKQIVVGILGATGAVGDEMRLVLQQRGLPVGLRLFASQRSCGKTMLFNGEEVPVQAVNENSFTGCDYVLGAVNASLSKKYAPLIKRAGAVYIDNSSAFRLAEDVPLVVPQINGEDAFYHSGIVANPNCVTIIGLMAVAAIEREAGISRIVASSYQAVSGAGAGGIAELKAQERELYCAGGSASAQVFAHKIVRNLIPQIGEVGKDGISSEENKLVYEGRKILHRGSDLKISCCCVRVPVLRSHCISICLETKRRITAKRAQEVIAAFPGCILLDEPAKQRYPMPLYATGQDSVLVGRVREDAVFDNGLSLFCCADQLRKGAAANAVDILQLLAGI